MQGFRTTQSCTTCKRRKKGCDLRRPACSRCQRLGTPCCYAERKWHFVSNAGEPDRIVPASQSPTSEAPWTPTGPSEISLARTSQDLQTLSAFWSIYLPREDAALDGCIGGVLAAPWISTVRSLAEGDSFLRITLQACASVAYGWMADSHVHAQRGLHLYAQALKATNEALRDPAQVRSDTVLASCRMLSLFEMFKRESAGAPAGQSQVTDWRTHVEGTCRLIQLRGRERHFTPDGIALYDGVRMTAIIHGLSRSTPNAFTDLKWSLPHRKTLRDELFDLISPVPALLQDIDRLGANIAQVEIGDHEQTLRQGAELLGRCVVHGSNLHDWEKGALGLISQGQPFGGPGADHNRVATNRTNASPLQLIDVCRSYGDGFFFLCTQYWAMCILLYGASRLCHRRLAELDSLSSQSIDLPQLPYWINPEVNAQHIAATTSHYFRPEAGLWSAQSAVFPVGTALIYFARTGRRESEPFKMMMEVFANSKAGTVMRDFVRNVVNAQANVKG